jgi:hypothetical protein
LASVDIIVDATKVDDASAAVDNVVELIASQNESYDINGEVMFRTSAPTFMPSAQPSSAPVTQMPTVAPTITGWVSTVRASKTTTSDIEQDTLDNYASDVADYYGVEPSDVTLSTNYESSGTMLLIIPDDVSQSELTDAITASLADSVGVHPQNVEVTVDMETGEVQFTIVSDTFNDAAGVSFDLNNYQNQNDITNLIQEALPSVLVDALDTSKDVTIALEITIDANDAENDLTQAAWQSERLLQDFDVSVENNVFVAN